MSANTTYGNSTSGDSTTAAFTNFNGQNSSTVPLNVTSERANFTLTSLTTPSVSSAQSIVTQGSTTPSAATSANITKTAVLSTDTVTTTLSATSWTSNQYTTEKTTTNLSTDAGKDAFRDPLIAMAVLACVFFVILIIILAMWCKRRRHVEVKTITIQPKHRAQQRPNSLGLKAIQKGEKGTESLDVEAANKEPPNGGTANGQNRPISVRTETDGQNRPISIRTDTDGKPASEVTATAKPTLEHAAEPPVATNGNGQPSGPGGDNPSFQHD